MRLRAGRLLSERDTETSQPVLVVNKSFADQYLGDDPIGRRLPLSLYGKADCRIVGVVDDMKHLDWRHPGAGEFGERGLG